MGNNIVPYVVRSLACHCKLENYNLHHLPLSLSNHLLICLQRRIIRRISTITINAPTLLSPLFLIHKSKTLQHTLNALSFSSLIPIFSQKKCVAPNGATHCKTHNSICCYTNIWSYCLQEEVVAKAECLRFCRSKKTVSHIVKKN